MDNNNHEFQFEDISSSSKPKSSMENVVKKTGKITKTVAQNTKKAAKFAKKLSDDYGEFSFKNIAGMIKLIAFVVSIGVALLFLVAAAIVFILDKTLFFLSALILLFGFAVALISLYLIYGLGLLISQNKEILRRLDSLDNEDY